MIRRRLPWQTLALILGGSFGWFCMSWPWPLAIAALGFWPAALVDNGRSMHWLLGADRDLWRWWTPALLHFSLSHWLFNSLALLHLGGLLERRLKPVWYAGLCALGIAVSNAAQGAWSQPHLFGGLSGLIFALIGTYGLLEWRGFGQLQPLGRGFYAFSGLWLILGFTPVFSSLLGVNVANGAHVGGLMVGVFAGAALALIPPLAHAFRSPSATSLNLAEVDTKPHDSPRD